MQDYTDYQELHKHKGTEHYKVTTLISNKNEVGYTFFDTINKNIITDSYFKYEDNRKYESLKIDSNGIVLDNSRISTILKDGTKWNSEYYSNWIINGDKTKHKYKDPLTPEEKNDADKWFRKFKKLYTQATSVYLDLSDYYFKIKSEWYYVESFDMGEKLDINIKKDYPEKYVNPRMIELQDLMPDFFSEKSRGKTKGFIELNNYQESERKEGTGINPIVGSAGYYMIDIIMPKGDTIKIKNYGVMYPNLKTYKIPNKYGGSDDVIFLIQEPNKSRYPLKQGGMYVIRPRKMK